MARYAQLIEALRKADAAGDKPAAELFARMLRDKEYEEESSGFASALQGIGQGATLGFADEAAAGIRAGLGEFADKTLGATMYGLGIGVDGEGSFGERFSRYREMADDDRSLGERYETALSSQRRAVETARREDPVITGVGELAGGLGTGGAGAARAVAGRTIASGLGRAAATGAGLGATAGYGYSEGDPLATFLSGKPVDQALNELSEAATGAGIGAVAGGVLGTAAPAVGGALRSIGRFITAPFTKNARLNEAGRRQIMEALQQDVAAGRTTLAEAQRELRSTPGMVAADLGPAMRDLAERVAQTPTRGARQIRDQLEQRAIGQYERVMPAVSRALGREGGDPSNFAGVSQKIIDSAKAAADPLYKQAYSTPVRVTRRMNDILHGTATGRVGMQAADDLARELQKKLPGIGKLGTMASTERLDLVIQSMDDHVNKLFQGGDAKLGRAARNLRNEFRDLVYQQNPTLREARKVWAGHAKSNEALEQGLTVFRDDADVTANMLRNMSEGERTYFRVGVLRAIERKLGNKPDTADVTKGLVDRRNIREALKVAFGDEKRFQEFVDTMVQEQKMFQTFSQAVGNSATARRLAQATDANEQIAALAGYGASLSAGGFLPPSIGGFLAKRGYRALMGDRPQRNLEQIAGRQSDLLMTRELKDIMRPATLGGLLDTGLPTTPARLMGAATAGGLLAPE